MRLGLGNSLARMGMRFGSADPVAAYIAALTAAGATVTAPKQAAISTFISGEIAAGRWDKMKRLYFPVWQVAAANAICMKSLTSGTFVGSVDHQARGVTPNNTSSYMNTNVSIPELGIASSYHYAALLPEGMSDGYDAVFGVIPDVYFYADDGTYVAYIEDVYIDLFSDAFTSGATLSILSLGGNSNDRYVKNRSSSVVSSYSNTQDFELLSYPSNQKIFLLGRNGGGNVNASGGFVGAFSMASELTTSEDTAYTLALKTLWETCTGFTIP